MNSLVHNKCERLMLEVLNEICFSYGISFEVDTKAKEEGGVVDWWQVFSTNSQAIQTICAILTLFITGAISLKALLPDQEKKLRMELLRLQIKEKEQGQQPADKPKENEAAKQNIDLGEVDISAFDILSQIENSKSLLIHRSTFFEQLISDERIYKFGAGLKDGVDEYVVSSNQFSVLIVPRPKQIDDSLEMVSIALVSPVFKRRKYKWKGLLDGEPISFKISDRKFNKMVRHEVFSFKNDDLIECSLRQKGDMDFMGDWIIGNLLWKKFMPLSKME